MATKNKKDAVADLLANIYHNNTRDITALMVRVPITDIFNSVSVNITVAQLQAEDDSSEPSLANIIDANKRGIFYYDSTDNTAVDDGGAACIVTSSNKRYKRLIQKSIDAQWYGKANYYFSLLSDATTSIKAFTRFVGLEVTILYNGEITTFWFKGGIADVNLVIKVAETHPIDFTIGDGGDLTPTDGTDVYIDPALLNATILGFWVAGRKTRVTVAPAVLTINDIYAQFIPQYSLTQGGILLKNGTFNDTTDYSIMYK